VFDRWRASSIVTPTDAAPTRAACWAGAGENFCAGTKSSCRSGSSTWPRAISVVGPARKFDAKAWIPTQGTYREPEVQRRTAPRFQCVAGDAPIGTRTASRRTAAHRSTGTLGTKKAVAVANPGEPPASDAAVRVPAALFRFSSARRCWSRLSLGKRRAPRVFRRPRPVGVDEGARCGPQKGPPLTGH